MKKFQKCHLALFAILTILSLQIVITKASPKRYLNPNTEEKPNCVPDFCPLGCCSKNNTCANSRDDCSYYKLCVDKECDSACCIDKEKCGTKS